MVETPGNSQNNDDNNGHSSEYQPQVSYEHIVEDTWVKSDEDGNMITGINNIEQDIAHELDDDDELPPGRISN